MYLYAINIQATPPGQPIRASLRIGYVQSAPPAAATVTATPRPWALDQTASVTLTRTASAVGTAVSFEQDHRKHQQRKANHRLQDTSQREEHAARLREERAMERCWRECQARPAPPPTGFVCFHWPRIQDLALPIDVVYCVERFKDGPLDLHVYFPRNPVPVEIISEPTRLIFRRGDPRTAAERKIIGDALTPHLETLRQQAAHYIVRPGQIGASIPGAVRCDSPVPADGPDSPRPVFSPRTPDKALWKLSTELASQAPALGGNAQHARPVSRPASPTKKK